MGAADRTVQRLRLRAPSAQAAVHAVHRLEDALRCASLPDADERVLLVRRLHLGRLPAGLSSQSLSLLIEQRVAVVGGEWVNGVEERAAHSDTVFFASRLQAAQAALRRRAQGSALSAWYWPLALPGVAVQAVPGVFVAQLLHAVSGWREAAAAWPALVDSVEVPATQDWWREHLPHAWRAHLARVVPREPQPEGAALRAQAAPGTSSPRADATPWLGVVPLAGGHGGVDNARAEGGTARHEHPPHRSERAAAARRATRMQGPKASGERRTGSAIPTEGTETPSSAEDAQPRAVLGASVREDAEPSGALVSRYPVEALATDAGGLLFLWPVLERLGFASQDTDPPDAWLGPRVLRLTLLRMRVPDTDPAWAMLASLPAMPQACEASDERAAQWLLACRRHARRVLRIGLASLVLRPGWLQWSATHIDVHFHRRDADIRVRRAALDINPGWIDGLQRVVGFHYDREDRRT